MVSITARRLAGIAGILFTVPFRTAVAQAAASEAASASSDPALARALGAVDSCAAHGEARRVAAAAAGGREAEALLTPILARQPNNVSALVGLARAVTQCLLPSADFAGQGELSARAIELLEQALTLDPGHWTARFVLGSIYYRSPAFLGRASLAAKAFDILLTQQGTRVDHPRFARPFELRGQLYARAGRGDSARAIWQRGAALFPADTVLQRLATTPVAPREPTPAPNPPSTPVPPATSTAPAALRAVRVVSSVVAAPTGPVAPSTRTLTKSEVLLAPGSGADVLQAVQLQPGATRVNEGSDVYTRGGEPHETATYVDGGRVLSLGRFEGLSGSMFGALEPFVVRAVRYSSGGFSARFGNALSGVLEIDTDGRPRERQLRAGLSLVQLSGTARAPLGKRAGAWVSSRASHTGALLATHGRAGEFAGAPHSQEMIASMFFAPTPMSEARTTLLVERDDARRRTVANGHAGVFAATGDTRALQLAGRWVSTTRPLALRANVMGTSRRSEWQFGALARERLETGVTSRLDAEWARSARVTWRAGVEHAALAREEEGRVPTTSLVTTDAPTRPITDALSAAHFGTYVETEMAGDAAGLTLGLRADRLPGERQLTLDPRVSIRAQRGAWTARVGGGVFHQGRFRAAPAIPDAITPSGAAGRATQLVIGLERTGTHATVRAEGYTKQYGAYRALGTGPTIVAGVSRGVDLVAQRVGGGAVSGWVGYSLLHARLRLADGRDVDSPFDITHAATASATWTINPDWSVGSTVRYGTGAPVTPMLGMVAASEGGSAGPDGGSAGAAWVPRYGTLLSERLPSYARVDTRVMRFVRAPGYLVTTYVEGINLAGRRNVTGLTYDASTSQQRPVHSFFASRTLVVGAELQRR